MVDLYIAALKDSAGKIVESDPKETQKEAIRDLRFKLQRLLRKGERVLVSRYSHVESIGVDIENPHDGLPADY